MKFAYILLIGFLYLSLNSQAQQLIRSPYEARMDSISMANFHIAFDKLAKKQRIATWRPINRVKFTMSTRLNRNVVKKVDISNGVTDMFSDLDADDYWSIGAYDIRGKVYLTKRFRLIGRMLITGIQYQTNFYSGGLIYKF